MARWKRGDAARYMRGRRGGRPLQNDGNQGEVAGRSSFKKKRARRREKEGEREDMASAGSITVVTIALRLPTHQEYYDHHHHQAGGNAQSTA